MALCVVTMCCVSCKSKQSAYKAAYEQAKEREMTKSEPVEEQITPVTKAKTATATRQEKITPIKEHQEMLKKELEKVSEHGSRLDTDEVKEVVRDFEGILERGIYEEIRLVVINLIDFIELDGEEITIHWSFT